MTCTVHDAEARGGGEPEQSCYCPGEKPPYRGIGCNQTCEQYCGGRWVGGNCPTPPPPSPTYKYQVMAVSGLNACSQDSDCANQAQSVAGQTFNGATNPSYNSSYQYVCNANFKYTNSFNNSCVIGIPSNVSARREARPQAARPTQKPALHAPVKRENQESRK